MKTAFQEIIEKLAKGKIKFVLIGGFAGIAHGCTYITQDVDICLDFSVENLRALQRVLKNLHPVHRMTPKRLKLELMRIWPALIIFILILI
jgi:CO dehydrogenase nickel-insertion accessory protein CooC1